MQILLLILFALILFRDEYRMIQLKSFECTINDEKFYNNYTCDARVLNNETSLLSFKVWAKRPLNTLIMSSTLLYKYDTVYREILHSPKVDWCRFINANSVPNRLFWIGIELIRSVDRSLIHPCPYLDVVYDDVRIPMNKMIAIFPAGEYRLIIRVDASDDEPMIEANITYLVLPAQLKSE